MAIVLFDTSIWVAILREQCDETLALRAQQLLRAGQAAWCSMVQLELVGGIRGAQERKKFRDIQATVYDLEITELVWQKSFQIAELARSKGITAPAADYLIYACSQVNSVELWHTDKHMDALARL